MKASIFCLPSVGSRAEIEAGMAATRPELYQRMLKELTELVKLADDLGYDSVSFTEHHFHIEGFELSNNPVLLDLYFAMQTKRIRVGQLGIVLPAANPIRVAEDIAMLDHMTGGRACAGFARGYQRRWVDVMAQQHGVSGTLPHHHDAIDQTNGEAFEENWQIIKKCWTEEMLAFKGKYWKVPAGATPWDLETTVKYGKGVENGMLTSVGVVPKPLQKPYPPVFLPRRRTLFAGQRVRASLRSCHRCMRPMSPRSSTFMPRYRVSPADRARVCCAMSLSRTRTTRPWRCGRTPGVSPAGRGSSRSASAEV
jgi:hypothetical protein